MKQAHLLDIDRLAYPQALELMRALAELRQKDLVPETLILLEHDPVITLGRRGSDQDLVESAEALKKKGISVHSVERGGMATYHGPGQLVAYPVCRLDVLGLGIAQFAHGLEEVALAALAGFGIKAGTRDDHPGVWLDGLKVASLGLAVRRGVTIHGLALNNDPDLSHFELINPCGLGQGVITSLARVLGGPLDSAGLRRAFVNAFGERFHLEMAPWTLEQARELVGPLKS